MLTIAPVCEFNLLTHFCANTKPLYFSPFHFSKKHVVQRLSTRAGPIV